MADRIKILYLMAGHPAIFGGGKRVFLQIMTHLNKEKFEFFSCCALNQEQENSLIKQGGQIIQIDIQHNFIGTSIKKLINLLREKKIDIIHSQGARADFYARLATRLAKQETKVVNTIAMLVEGFDIGHLKKGVYCYLDRLSERYVDKFIVVSNALKENLVRNHSIPDQKVITIYNGIELYDYQINQFGEYPRKIKKELGINDNEITVCAIGRMVWQKGLEYLIDSIPMIINEFPNLKILLVGDGPLRKRLEDLCEMLGVTEKVIFTGFRKDINRILREIDVLVIPSLLEGFPMITLEAMAMAKPIIASDIPGIREQIKDGESGILVSPKDSKALAAAILKILADNRAAENIGLAARQTVEEKFLIEKMVMQTERLYSSLHEG